MTINEFEYYKTLSNKVLDLLIEEKHSSLKDIKIIYNIIMGFPYCLDSNGQYAYEGRFYNSIDDLPKQALMDILSRLERLLQKIFHQHL